MTAAGLSIAYVPLILFTVSTCGTPGPNNMMVMASGVNYGFRRSLPHVIGINTGFPLMVVAVGLGLGGVLRNFPVLYDILRPIGAAYLLYLAYRTATASPVTPGDAADARPQRRPLSLVQAALFQLVNPKSWVMIVGALVTYATATGDYLLQVFVIALIFLVFGTPCTSGWLWIGMSLKRVLTRPLHFRVFNVGMACLLVISLVPILGEIYRTFVH
jgi:threonine/homoserine/homoserine lactone efflux protein